ncbi:MAG: TIM barrel protein, partial [Ignavibacteria bacterium]|nr:TIM barrel protein [Ignavibacteria bacterium]
MISSSTLLFHSFDTEKAIKTLKSAGFDELDLCQVNGVAEHISPFIRDESGFEKLSSIINNYKVRITSFTVYPRYPVNYSHESFLITKEHLIKYFKLAGNLNVKYVVIPSGTRVGSDYWENELRLIKSRLEELSEYSGKCGTNLCLEVPHWHTFAETTKECGIFFENLDKSIFCAFDTSHAMIAGKNPKTIDEVARTIGYDRIKVIHFRDSVGMDISMTPGRGEIVFKNFVEKISKYKNVVYSLELEGIKSPKRKISELVFSKNYIGSLLEGKEKKSGSFVNYISRTKAYTRNEIGRIPVLINILRKGKKIYKRFTKEWIYDGKWTKHKFDVPEKIKMFRNPVSVGLSDNQSKKVVIVGSGGAGTYHSAGFTRLEGIKVTGVCDVNQDFADNLANKIGCKSYNSLYKMIEEQNPDLVSVCTREWQHYRPVMLALESGCDVFCEKILESRYELAREMVESSLLKNKILGVNYNYRFKPGISTLKKLFDEGIFGELFFIRLNIHAFSYNHGLDLVYLFG